MNRKAQGIKLFYALVIVVVAILVAVYIFIYKPTKQIGLTDTMCGPVGFQGKCACCYEDKLCPVDLPRESSGNPSCPANEVFCNVQGKEGKYCDNAAGWKQLTDDKRFAPTRGTGTCCMADRIG